MNELREQAKQAQIKAMYPDGSQAMRTERDILMCLAAAIGKDRAIRTKVFSRYDVNSDAYEMVCWHDGKFYPFGLGEAVDGEYLDRVLQVVETILGKRFS